MPNEDEGQIIDSYHLKLEKGVIKAIVGIEEIALNAEPETMTDLLSLVETIKSVTGMEAPREEDRISEI